MSKLSTSLGDLDFANKSWADIVFEEEEEENRRKFEEEERKKKKLKLDAECVWRDRLRSPAKNPVYSTSSPRSASKSRSEKKSPAPKICSQESKRNRKIISPSKSFVSPVKTDKRRILRSSPAKNWRTRKVIDDDSQDTLTESARIKNAPVKRNHASTVDDVESRFPTIPEDHQDPKRARRSEDQTIKRRSGPPKWFPKPEAWVEPKHGYESDPSIIARRDKDITFGYKSLIYQKYAATIPKSERIKGFHPRTPNKFLKVPRRSWDTQIKLWRRMMYYVMDMEPASSDCSFLSSTSESSENNQSANVSFTSSASGSDASEFLFTDGDFPPLFSECTEATVTGSSKDQDGPTNFACLAVAAAR